MTLTTRNLKITKLGSLRSVITKIIFWLNRNKSFRYGISQHKQPLSLSIEFPFTYPFLIVSGKSQIEIKFILDIDSSNFLRVPSIHNGLISYLICLTSYRLPIKCWLYNRFFSLQMSDFKSSSVIHLKIIISNFFHFLS